MPFKASRKMATTMEEALGQMQVSGLAYLAKKVGTPYDMESNKKTNVEVIARNLASRLKVVGEAPSKASGASSAAKASGASSAAKPSEADASSDSGAEHFGSKATGSGAADAVKEELAEMSERLMNQGMKLANTRNEVEKLCAKLVALEADLKKMTGEQSANSRRMYSNTCERLNKVERLAAGLQQALVDMEAKPLKKASKVEVAAVEEEAEEEAAEEAEEEAAEEAEEEAAEEAEEEAAEEEAEEEAAEEVEEEAAEEELKWDSDDEANLKRLERLNKGPFKVDWDVLLELRGKKMKAGAKKSFEP